MKVAIITDTHYGGKNDNVSFAQFQRRFYDETFFPILKGKELTRYFIWAMCLIGVSMLIMLL